jgi:hypothetical protein
VNASADSAAETRQRTVVRLVAQAK